MRNPSTWANYAPDQETDLMIAGRGFTGHEHLKWFKLINMNGRMYDPLIGQFLSPDNYVQSPGFTQSFNRFGYCLNNPLKYTDPSGYLMYYYLDPEMRPSPIEFSGFANPYYKPTGGNSRPYTYDWRSGTYVNSEGLTVSYNEVYYGFVKPNDALPKDKEITHLVFNGTRTNPTQIFRGYIFSDQTGWFLNYGGYGTNYDNFNAQSSNDWSVAQSEGAISNWLSNSDPVASLGLTTRTGAGAGGKISVLGIQAGISGNIYSSKRSGVISTNGITSQGTRISNFSINYSVLGFEYERNWSGNNNMVSFDLGPIHFENGNYPTLRIFSVSWQFIGGGSVDIDLNLGRIINAYSQSVMYYYNNSGSVPLLYH
jgi:RHS repeat-associated protein